MHSLGTSTSLGKLDENAHSEDLLERFYGRIERGCGSENIGRHQNASHERIGRSCETQNAHCVGGVLLYSVVCISSIYLV